MSRVGSAEPYGRRRVKFFMNSQSSSDGGLRFLSVKDHQGCRQETSNQSWRRRWADSPPHRTAVFQLGCQMIRSRSAELMVPVQLKTYRHKILITIASYPVRREVLRSEAPRVIAVCFTLKMNGRSVAFQVGMIRYQIYILQELGFDRELESSSPGVSLLFASFVEITNRGLSELNFGIGDAQYKFVLATGGRAEYAPLFFGTRLRPRVDSATFTIAGRIEIFLRSLFSSSSTARLRRAWRNVAARRRGTSMVSSKESSC